MTDHGGPADDETPAERRVTEYLELLRDDAPHAGRALTLAVVRTARWQRALRTPLHAAAMLGVAVAEALRLVIGGRRGGGRP